MFVKPKNSNSFFKYIFPQRGRRLKTRRPVAGRARMARYLDTWTEKEPAQDVPTPPVRVSEENAFVLADGRRLYSLPQLRDAFTDLSDEHFAHHTREHGNDFARWLRDVWGEETAAALLERCSNREEAYAVLRRLCRRRTS